MREVLWLSIIDLVKLLQVLPSSGVSDVKKHITIEDGGDLLTEKRHLVLRSRMRVLCLYTLFGQPPTS